MTRDMARLRASGRPICSSKRSTGVWARRRNEPIAGGYRMTRKLLVFTAMALSLMAPASIDAQGRGGQGGQAPASAQAAAPVDLMGYWVSVVTEDWRYRMVTAPKGDHPGVPLNAEGNRVANAWDPAKD